MKIDREIFHKKLVPITYALIWAAGLIVGLYDILPDMSTRTGRLLVLSMSVYSVFIFESIVGIIDAGVWQSNWKHIESPNVAIAAQLGIMLLVIFVCGLLYVENDFSSFWIAVAFMVIHKWLTSMFFHDIDSYQTEASTEPKMFLISKKDSDK